MLIGRPDTLTYLVTSSVVSNGNGQALKFYCMTSLRPGEEYVAIFKHGDDLRQDQLILQVAKISLVKYSKVRG